MDKTISVINSTDNTIIDTINIHIQPTEISIDPTKSILYTVNDDQNILSLIDLTNSSKTNDILFDSISAMTIINDKLYFTSSHPEFINIINPINNNIHYIKLDSRIRDITFNNITDLMYTVDWRRELSSEYAIDVFTSTGNIITSILLDNKSKTDIEINNNTGVLYLANPANNTLLVLNPTNNSLIDTIQVGKNPKEFASSMQ